MESAVKGVRGHELTVNAKLRIALGEQQASVPLRVFGRR